MFPRMRRLERDLTVAALAAVGTCVAVLGAAGWWVRKAIGRPS